MRQALLEGDLRKFGLLLHEGWENKKKISSKISNSAIDQMYSVAIDHGAIGGKITGAGSGGFMLLYCDEENQPAVREAFTGLGIREMRFSFDFNGTRVLVNDPFIDQDENCASQWTFVGTAQHST
jgi:D-glycero-alpha-D-manno-heptose-7-phosphate kinase